MQSAFVIVVIAVGVVGVLGALVALVCSRGAWEQLGRDQMLMDSDRSSRPHRTPAPRSPAAIAERDGEIRQMLEAGNARRRRRGEPELDVEAELARRLAAGVPSTAARPPAGEGRDTETGAGAGTEARAGTEDGAGAAAGRDAGAGAPEIDPQLRAEIRELVVARNHRRVRRGRPALDVDTEVAREIARLGEG